MVSGRLYWTCYLGKNCTGQRYLNDNASESEKMSVVAYMEPPQRCGCVVCHLRIVSGERYLILLLCVVAFNFFVCQLLRFDRAESYVWWQSWRALIATLALASEGGPVARGLRIIS